MNEYMEFLRNAIIGWYDNSIYEYHGLDDPEFIEKVCGVTGMTEEFYSDFILNSNNPKFGLMLTENTSSSEIFANMSYQQKDDVYRMVWSDRCVEDAKSHMRENMNPMHEEIIGEIAEAVANRFVYDGDYDCSDISYWDNIENLVKEESKKPDERILQFLYRNEEEENGVGNITWKVSGKTKDVGVAAWLWQAAIEFSNAVFRAKDTYQLLRENFLDNEIDYLYEIFPNKISCDPITAYDEVLEKIKKMGLTVEYVDYTDEVDVVTSHGIY